MSLFFYFPHMVIREYIVFISKLFHMILSSWFSSFQTFRCFKCLKKHLHVYLFSNRLAHNDPFFSPYVILTELLFHYSYFMKKVLFKEIYMYIFHYYNYIISNNTHIDAVIAYKLYFKVVL